MAEKTFQEELDQLYKEKTEDFTTALKEYYDKIDNINVKVKKNASFWDYAGALYTLVPESVKGVTTAFTDFINTGVNLLVQSGDSLFNFWSSASKGNFQEAGRDFAFGWTNVPLTLIEGFANSFFQAGATLATLGQSIAPGDGSKAVFGTVSNLFQQNQLTIANVSQAARATILGEEDAFNSIFSNMPTLDSVLNPRFTSFNPDGSINFQDLAKQGERYQEGVEQQQINREAVQSQYGEVNYGKLFGTEYTFEDFTKDSVSFRNQTVSAFDNAIDTLLFAKGVQETSQFLFEDSDFYQALRGTATSIGNIASMLLVAKVVKSTSGSVTPQQVAFATKSYYASQIAGRSYAEAISNGADIQDAFTYALGVAASETAIESIGGLKFDSLLVNKQYLKSMLDEGLEEVIAEAVQPGLEMYSTGEQMQMDAGEILTNGLYSFLSGAAASGFIGGSQSIVLNTTYNNRVQKISDHFSKNVEKYGEEFAVEKFKSEVEALVNKFNGKITMGQVFDEKGNMRIKNMNEQEKVRFINNSLLMPLVKLDNNGKFSIIQENFDKINKDMFVNKDKDGNIINDDEYAINKSVKGVDVTDEGKYQPKKVSELSKPEKMVYDMANRMNVPIAIYAEEQNGPQTIITTGVYGKNGVLYISESSINRMNPQQIGLSILKHEAIHELRARDPEAFESLEKSLENIVQISYEELEDGSFKPVLTFSSPEIESAIGEQLRKDIETSFEDYADQGARDQRILNVMEEELPAYFTEKIITDAAFLDLVEQRTPRLFERIKKAIGLGPAEFNSFEIKNKAVIQQIKDYAKTWREVTTRIQEQRGRIDTYLDRLFGGEMPAYAIFKKEAIAKYGLKNIEQAMFNYDRKNNTIQLNGETVSLQDIFAENFNWDELNPKRVRAMTEEEIRENFNYDETKEKKYKTYLRKLYKFLDEAIVSLESGPERSAVRRKISLVEELLEEESLSVVTKDNELLDLLLEAVLHSTGPKNIKDTTEKKLQRTDEGKVLLRLVTRAVREIKKGSGFKDFKNGAINYGAAYYSEKVENETKAKDITNVLNIWINNYAGSRNLFVMRDKYEADYSFDPETNIATFMILPTEEHLKQEIEAEQLRLEQEEKQEDEAQLENNDLSNEQRKELQKYYTSKQMATTVFNNVVSILDGVGIDINDLTVIESSAGAGAFLEVFNEFNPEIKVLAYDISPESPLVSSQDFLTLEKDFDQDSIVIGNPPFKNDLDAQFINKSLEISPAVAFILPGTWANSLRKQKQIDDKYILVYNETLGIETFKFNDQQIPVKTVMQVWVNPNAEPRYAKLENIRRTKPNPKKSPYFEHVFLPGIEKNFLDFKKEVEEGFNFDFAVYSSGNYSDFNKKITDVNQMSPKTKYIVVKARSDAARKVLNEIDYEKLAMVGSDHRKGFRLYDLIEEFDRRIDLKRTQRIADIGEKTTTDSNNYVLSQEQIDFFKESKVRNQEGKLLRLFHGSLNEDITRFSSEFAGQATGVPENIIYFTNDYNTAVDFSAEKMPTYSQFVEEKTGKYGVVYETYLNVQNPLDLTNMTQKDEALLEKLIGEKFGIINEKGRQWVENVKLNNQLAKTVLNDEVLKENGYDGLIAEMYVNSGVFEYGIIEPNQVKSTNNLNPQDTDNIYDDDISLRRTQKNEKLEIKASENILRVFGDEYLSSYFTTDKKGNLVPKSKFMSVATPASNKVKIRYNNEKNQSVEEEFNGTDYVLVNNRETDTVVDISNLSSNLKNTNKAKFRFIKQSELNEDEKTLFDVLKSLKINFIAFDSVNKSNTGGFSVNNLDLDIVFINFKYALNNPSWMFEILVHEYTHEIFKTNQDKLTDSLEFFLDIMFDPTGDPRPAFSDMLNLGPQGFTVKTFINYLNKNYNFGLIKNANDIGKLLSLAYQKQITKQNDPQLNSVVNELIAQFYGMIFASETFINKYFSAKDLSPYSLYRIYDDILKNNPSKHVQIFIEKHSKAFLNAKKAHEKYMKSLFPSKKEKISGTTINSFINKFSDGQFKTRAELAQAYLEEVKKGKRGLATSVFNNALYLSTKFSAIVTSGVNQYQKISDELRNMLNTIDLLVENPEQSSFITKDGIIKDFKDILQITKNAAVKTTKAYQKAGNSVGLVSPFSSIAYLQNIEEKVSNFVEQYLDVNEDILKAFDLPSHQEMSNLLDQISNTFIDRLVSIIDDFRKNNITEEDLFRDTLAFGTAMSNAIEQTLGAIASLENGSYSNLLGINNIQSNVIKRDAAIFFRDLRSAIKLAKKNVLSKTRTAESGFNTELKSLLEILNEMINVIRTNQGNLTKTKNEMLGKIREIQEVLFKSERLNDLHLQVDNKGNLSTVLTQNEIKKEYLYGIYGSFGAIYGVENILEIEFPDEQSVQGRTLKELGFKKSYSSFSMKVYGLIKSLETEYTTVFSQDTKNHQAYAQELVEKLSKIEPSKENDHLKFFTNKVLSQIMVRQDLLQIYAETFEKYNLDFFKVFWELYYSAAHRSEDILANYNRESVKFLENNKGILEWEKEKVQLPKGTFISFNESEYLKAKNEVEQTYEELAERIKKLNEELKNKKNKWDESKKQLREISDKIKKLSNKATQKYQLLKQEYDKQYAYNKQVRLSYLKTKDEIFKEKKQVLPKQLLLKEKLLEVAKNKKYETPFLTKGELITLYQSLIREQEMHDEDQSIFDPEKDYLQPTLHFTIGNGFHRFDSELQNKLFKDYADAKNEAKSSLFTQLLEREVIIEKLAKIIAQEDNYAIAIDYGKRRFNKNYDNVNAIYKQIYQKDMPKQQTYIPFRSIDSDWVRDFELKLSGGYNVGVSKGFTLATKLGATNPLAIQNYFSVITGSTNATAKYSYERIVRDFQNLLVTKTNNTSFQQALQFIDKGGFVKFFEESFKDILGYGSADMQAFEKMINDVLNNTVVATMAINLPSFVKQYVSLSTVVIRNKLSLAKMTKNIAIHGIPFTMTEHRKWLLENNSNFYFRNLINSNLALSEAQNSGESLGQLKNALDKSKDVLGAPVGWSDSTVIVAAFATIAEDIQKKSPDMTQEEVFENANEQLNRTVMLSGVANTNSAFRARYSTNKNTLTRIISRYQSESILQVSYFLRQLVMASKGFKDAEPIRAAASLVASAAFSGLIGALFSRLRGFTRDDEEMFQDFLYNEFIIQNLIGSIPYINAVTNLFQFDVTKDTPLLEKQYDFKFPLISEVTVLVDSVLKTYQNLREGKPITRNIIKTSETLGQMLGLGVRNIFRIGEYISMVNSEANVAFEEFYYSRTSAEQLRRAIDSGDSAKIQNYIARSITNNAVKGEITSLVLRTEDAELNLRQYETFKAKNPITEEMVEYKIPERINEKYKLLTQRGLQTLMRTVGYRRLPDEEKIKAVQRVFNYYYEFMKNEILVKEYAKLSGAEKREIDYDKMRKKTILDVNQVVANAIRG